MSTFYTVAEVLLVLALLGFVGAVASLVVIALHIKTFAMTRGKRLADIPTRSVKNLIATGKGIAQQETVRAKRIAVVVKRTAGVVKHTAAETKAAAQTVHPADLKAAAGNVRETLGTLADAQRIYAEVQEILQTAGRQAPKAS